MQRADPGRLRTLAVSVASLVGMLLLSILIPGTSSAFTALVKNTSDTAASKTTFQCADTFKGDRRRSTAFFEFALDEPADATTAADSSDANNPGTYRGSNAKDGSTEKTAASACPNDAGGAYRLDGSTSRVSTAKQYAPITGSFSEEVWFKTSTAGKLLGFESSSDVRSSNYDKHLYVGSSGRLFFGIYNGTVQTLMSPANVADGQWHYAVATTASDGSRLYVDGVQVDANPNHVTAENFSGYWRIGWGNLESWPEGSGPDSWFTGAIRFAAAYPSVLTAGEVASAWSIGRPGSIRKVDAEPTATATATATATPVPESTATAVPESSVSPAASATPEASGSATATTAPAPVKGGGTPIYQPAPAPAPSDVSAEGSAD